MRGYDHLYGLELLELSEPRCVPGCRVRDELKQPAGLVHGGVYASLAESVTSLATAFVVMPEGSMAMGLSNSTNFLRPITDGADARASPRDCTGAARRGSGMCA